MNLRNLIAAAATIPALLLLTFALSAPAAAQGQCAAGQYTYTFQNFCPFPVWTAQTAAAGNNQSYPPQGGNWALAGRCTTNAACGSGTCDTNSGQCTCSTSADCSGGATCGSDNKCTSTATFCMPQAWSSGTFWPRTSCTAVGTTGLNCATGQCNASGSSTGLLDCGVGISSPTNPVTQFEVSSSAGAANYDISLVAGSNVEMEVTPLGGSYFLPGVAAPQNAVACYAAGCTAALACPANLVAPGGGCLDPCTQCQRSAPAGSAPNATIYAALKCSSTIATDFSGNAPATTQVCSGVAGTLPTYQDMYCVQNMTDPVPNAQASSNQGTDTAFSQDDCFPGKTFVVPAWPTGYAPPAGVGVCLYASAPQNTIPGFNDYGWFDYASNATLNCSTQAEGAACGGYLTGQSDNVPGGTAMATYPTALGYTCRTVTWTDQSSNAQTSHLCLPPTTSGLGSCVYDSLSLKPLYNAVGGVFNAAWLTAGVQAGGGTTPYYATFKAACSSAYTWQYDDASAGFACNAAATPAIAANPPSIPSSIPAGAAFSGFNVTYCGSLAPPPPQGASASPPGFGAPGPTAVTAFVSSGSADNVGAGAGAGSVRVAGRFDLPVPLPLDRVTVHLTDVLDEVGAGEELTQGTGALRYLPLTLTADGQSKPSNAIFRSATGTRPAVTLGIANHPRTAGVLQFVLTVDGATIRAPARCSGGTTKLETGFDLEFGARIVRVGAILPWDCHGTSLTR